MEQKEPLGVKYDKNYLRVQNDFGNKKQIDKKTPDSVVSSTGITQALQCHTLPN